MLPDDMSTPQNTVHGKHMYHGWCRALHFLF